MLFYTYLSMSRQNYEWFIPNLYNGDYIRIENIPVLRHMRVFHGKDRQCLQPDVLEKRHEHLPMYVIITVVCENWRNASGWLIPDETGRNKNRAHPFFLLFEHPSHCLLITSAQSFQKFAFFLPFLIAWLVTGRMAAITGVRYNSLSSSRSFLNFITKQLLKKLFGYETFNWQFFLAIKDRSRKRRKKSSQFFYRHECFVRNV